MDAKYFREKPAVCAQLATGLPSNNSGRFSLLDIADEFRRLAADLEAQASQDQQQQQDRKGEGARLTPSN
jgi:hypothetical protein